MTYNPAMRRLAAAALTLAVVAAPHRFRIGVALAQSTATPATLIELRDAADLEARFNEDRGKTRLVLLVSPT